MLLQVPSTILLCLEELLDKIDMEETFKITVWGSLGLLLYYFKFVQIVILRYMLSQQKHL